VTTYRRLTGDLFIGSHAVAEGLLTKKQIGAGLYRRVLRNVYAEPHLVHDHQLKVRAAALLMPPEAAISGRSAAAWFGAPFSSASDPVLVVVPRDCRWKGPKGVQVHRTDLRPGEMWISDEGIRLTTVRRTAWDISTLDPLMTAVALIDGMLQYARLHDGELTEPVLAREFATRRGRWGSRRAQFLLPLVDGRAMSPPESRVRVACHLAGLPHPGPLLKIVVGGVSRGPVHRPWPEAKLIVEYEGAYHFDELQIRKDDARYEAMVAAGWHVIRLSSIDLRDLDAVVDRIRAALAQSGSGAGG
jgi:hypothetical protein